MTTDPRIKCAACGGTGEVIKHRLDIIRHRLDYCCDACKGTGVASAEECALRALERLHARYSDSMEWAYELKGVEQAQLDLDAAFRARDEAIKR